jgi:hypothetical protein
MRSPSLTSAMHLNFGLYCLVAEVPVFSFVGWAVSTDHFYIYISISTRRSIQIESHED